MPSYREGLRVTDDKRIIDLTISSRSHPGGYDDPQGKPRRRRKGAAGSARGTDRPRRGANVSGRLSRTSERRVWKAVRGERRISVSKAAVLVGDSWRRSLVQLSLLDRGPPLFLAPKRHGSHWVEDRRQLSMLRGATPLRPKRIAILSRGIRSDRLNVHRIVRRTACKSTPAGLAEQSEAPTFAGNVRALARTKRFERDQGLGDDASIGWSVCCSSNRLAEMPAGLSRPRARRA
jgi:hypothetical protein